MLRRTNDLVSIYETYREQLAQLTVHNNVDAVRNLNMCLHRARTSEEGPPDGFQSNRYYTEGTARGQIAAIFTQDNELATDQFVSLFNIKPSNL